MLAYHKVNNINAKVGIYLRISLEDGDKLESNSIENQRKLIYQYLNENNFTNIKEFVDDGATGTNFNRKGFKDLLRNIENGNINTVITKDVSRIGRNYVKTGYYIEDYFLNKGVRYISILDNMDTYSDLITNELLPFRAILNEMYSKDISLKQRSSLIERKKRGRYIACYAPYGYKKHPTIIGKLEIDEEAANVVKRTFELYIQGYGTSYIANKYTKEKIPTPAMKLNMNVDKDSIFHEVWKPTTIRKILRNETYLGYMIQNKETTISYKNHTRVYLKEDDHIKIENHHTPIIDVNTFKKVNEMLDSKKIHTTVKKEKNILHDFLFCDECKKKLIRRDCNGKIIYFCITRARFNLCDNSNYVNYNDIESAVLTYISNYVKKYSNREKLKTMYLSEYQKEKTKMDEYKNTLSEFSKKLLKVNNKLDTLYEDKLNNLITEDMYKNYSLNLKEEQKNCENKINEMDILIDNVKTELKSLEQDKQKISEITDKFCKLESINKEIINEFIEKIYIDKNRDFHIKLKFNF